MKRRAREDPKKELERWNKDYFYSKDYENLDGVVEDVLVNPDVQDHLRALVGLHHGLRLGMVSYKDFSKVWVTYGLALDDDEDPLGETALYFRKDPHLVSSLGNLGDVRLSDKFLREDWETGQEFYGVPKVSTFVNALNNSLKNPLNKRERLFGYNNE